MCVCVSMEAQCCFFYKLKKTRVWYAYLVICMNNSKLQAELCVHQLLIVLSLRHPRNGAAQGRGTHYAVAMETQMPCKLNFHSLMRPNHSWIQLQVVPNPALAALVD